jgi:hypothetical protein
MFTLPVLAALAVASLVTAQSGNTALELAAIKAHFQAAGLVPSLLSTFDPSAVLNVTYAGVGSVSPGQLLTGPRELCHHREAQHPLTSAQRRGPIPH